MALLVMKILIVSAAIVGLIGMALENFAPKTQRAVFTMLATLALCSEIMTGKNAPQPMDLELVIMAFGAQPQLLAAPLPAIVAVAISLTLTMPAFPEPPEAAKPHSNWV